jgi:choice-of-anchor C domain-containing protein
MIPAVPRLLFIPVLFVTNAVSQEPSLIINGSFEESPAVSAYLNVVAGSGTIKGWVVTGEGVDVVADRYWPASDGVRSVDLDGSARSRTTPPFTQGGLAQTFPTTPGTRYLVRFDLSGNPVKKPVVKPIRISAAGQSAEFTFDVSGTDFRNMGWSPRTWTFIAKASSTTLEFRSLTASPLTGYGPAIDNVAVSALEDPSLELTENEQEIQVSLSAGVLFDSGKYDLKADATKELQELAILLEEHPGLPVLIEGHTDSQGTPEANQVLSENRANAVKQWLTSNAGIASDRIMTNGYGQSVPVASNDTAEGRQKNRRVEIKLPKKPSNSTVGESR